MPGGGTGAVCQKSEPRLSDAFSSKVSSAGVEHEHVDRPPERPDNGYQLLDASGCVRAGSRFRQRNGAQDARDSPHRSLHPGLVEQKPPLRVVLIVADAFRDEVEVAPVIHRHDGRAYE
jgi:hypothetical protein